MFFQIKSCFKTVCSNLNSLVPKYVCSTAFPGCNISEHVGKADDRHWLEWQAPTSRWVLSPGASCEREPENWWNWFPRIPSTSLHLVKIFTGMKASVYFWWNIEWRKNRKVIDGSAFHCSQGSTFECLWSVGCIEGGWDMFVVGFVGFASFATCAASIYSNLIPLRHSILVWHTTPTLFLIPLPFSMLLQNIFSMLLPSDLC